MLRIIITNKLTKFSKLFELFPDFFYSVLFYVPVLHTYTIDPIYLIDIKNLRTFS